jgi:hypothetical protein
MVTNTRAVMQERIHQNKVSYAEAPKHVCDAPCIPLVKVVRQTSMRPDRSRSTEAESKVTLEHARTQAIRENRRRKRALLTSVLGTMQEGEAGAERRAVAAASRDNERDGIGGKLKCTHLARDECVHDSQLLHERCGQAGSGTARPRST